MNSVFLMGRLGAKPEVRRVGNDNVPVTSVSIATSGWSKGGKTTDWHNVTLWDKQAELISRCDKGEMVLVEGSLKHDKYTDKDGNERTKTYVRGFRFEFCGSPKSSPQTGAVGPTSNPYGDNDLKF
jgi:single-strand DNA-binding protein